MSAQVLMERVGCGCDHFLMSSIPGASFSFKCMFVNKQATKGVPLREQVYNQKSEDIPFSVKPLPHLLTPYKIEECKNYMLSFERVYTDALISRTNYYAGVPLPQSLLNFSYFFISTTLGRISFLAVTKSSALIVSRLLIAA